MLNGQKDEQDKLLEQLIPVGKYKVIDRSSVMYYEPVTSRELVYSYNAGLGLRNVKAPFHCVVIGDEQAVKATREVKAAVLSRNQQRDLMRARRRAIAAWNKANE